MKIYNTLTALFLCLCAMALSSCGSDESDYDFYYSKLINDGKAKLEVFATVMTEYDALSNETRYWFDYNGYRYSPIESPISEAYAPVDEYGKSLVGNRVYIVFEADDSDLNKNKDINLVLVRNVETVSAKVVETYAQADYYGNDPLKITTYNYSADGKYLDLVLTIQNTMVSRLNLIYNLDAQDPESINSIFDLKHERTQGTDDSKTMLYFISFEIPDDINVKTLGKDNMVVRYYESAAAQASLFIPTL